MASKGTRGVKGSYSTGNADYIDKPILLLLPKEGEMIGQFQPKALTTKIIAKRLEVNASMVVGRLNLMHGLGQVASVRLVPISQGIGWQITSKGLDYLNQNGEGL
jgi:hypothetical protein